MQTMLTIDGLKLKVNLGITAQERAKKQAVSLDINILFPKPPRACETDTIEDTVCYDALAAKIRKFCTKKKYFLIEHLAYQLYRFIKKNIPKKCKLYLEIKKEPPIKGLRSCSFIIEND